MRNNIWFIIVALSIGFSISCSNKSIPLASTTEIKGSGYDSTLYNLTLLEATKLKMLGNTADAIKYLEKALEINPGSDAACYEISQIAQMRGDIENAKKYALMAFERDGDNTWYLANAANIYYNTNNLDSAALYYVKLLELQPENEDVKFNLGTIYLENGNHLRAEKIFTEFKNKYGREPQIMMSLLNAKGAQGKNEDSEVLLKELIDDDPENIGYLGMLAELYRNMGRKEESTEIYGRLFERDPENGILQLSYMDFLLEEEDYEQVVEIINILIINDKINREDKLKVFFRLLQEEKIYKEKSNEIIIAALLLEANYKNDPNVIILVSEIYAKAGNQEKELEKLEAYISENPEQYIVWERLLLRYNELQETDRLYILSKEASRKFNMVPLPKLLYAFAATEKGEYDIAIAELNKVRILVNNQAEYLNQVLSMEADIYYKQGKLNEAFKKFDEALELNPDDPVVLNNYSYYLAENNMEFKRARNMIEKCLGIERNITYLDTYAWVLFKERKYKDAESVMKEIFATEEIKDAELLEHYGFIKEKLRKCPEAIDYWKKALSVDPEKTYLKEKIRDCLEKK